MKSWRLYIFLGGILIVAAIIISRLFYLQIIGHKFYQSQALGQQAGFQEVVGNRGEVFIANSKENDGSFGSGQTKSLAINKESWLVHANPEKVKDKNYFSEALSKEFASLTPPVTVTEEFISSQLQRSGTYSIIKKDLSKENIDAIKKIALGGLYAESSQKRYYPQESLASQVIGFVGGDGSGQYGIEGYYDEILSGKKGIKEEKRGLGSIAAEDFSYLNGSDLYLTIDYNIQFQAEALLQQAKKDINIDSGQIIVVKPDSGRIIALANFPSFNPNAYSKESHLEIFQNSTVQKIFEPGSVFKPFIMAIALQEHKVTPETTFNDVGFVKIGPDTVYNFDRKKYDLQDMSGILEKSINTGAVFLSQLLSHQTFLDYIDEFGFTQKTGIDLQGEVYSRNEILRNGSAFGYATASFGQGIEMTSLQLVSAFCAFANGGKVVKPFMVEKIVHGQDQIITHPQLSEPVISPKTASEVTTMLTNVVNRGFGNSAKVNGYYLAGKTGTAEVPIEGKKGYYLDRTIQSFIGYGPSLKPQFLILVKLDNPKVPKSSLSAAPIFKKLAQYIINYWQIPPDY